jgi:hypothetical protein
MEAEKLINSQQPITNCRSLMTALLITDYFGRPLLGLLS